MQRIFVGDVQGCADELDEILDRAQERFGRDFELWAVGDLVNRGPASLRVLRRVRELHAQGRARVVLGNHEVGLLECALGLREPGRLDTARAILDEPDADDWIRWLRSWPLVETGTLGARSFAMVHAAVPAGWALPELEARAEEAAAPLRGGDRGAGRLLDRRRSDERADLLRRLVSCRSVTADGGWSAKLPEHVEGGRPWHALHEAAAPGYGVVYGHWALQGLHLVHGLRGLDTGCVHHGRSGDGFLTAWLPDERREDPFALPDDGFWQVRAQRRYWPEDE